MMQQTIHSPVNTQERAELGIRPGDTVRVWQKIEEKGKTRLQLFEGLVLARKHGREPGATFTVRRVASGVGVEKIFPLYSPMIDKIEIVKRTKVRRAKLYYIRDKAAKEVRRAMRGAYMLGQATESDIARQAREEAEAEALAKQAQEDSREEAREVENETPASDDATPDTQETETETEKPSDDASAENAQEAKKE